MNDLILAFLVSTNVDFEWYVAELDMPFDILCNFVWKAYSPA